MTVTEQRPVAAPAQGCGPRRHRHTPCAPAHRVAPGAAGTNVYARCGAHDAEGGAAPWNGWVALARRLALGIAARLNRRVRLRARRVSDLQWLCPACHAASTDADIRVIHQLDRELKSPNATLFGTHTATLPGRIHP